jgi:hypothetical protein
MTVTVRQLSQVVVNENLPVAVTNPTEIAILAAAPTAWWSNNQATMQGVLTAAAYNWKDRVNQLQLSDAVTAINPTAQTDSGTGIANLRMGYGGSLAQRNFVVCQVQEHVGGSGYVVGDTIRDAGGTVLTVTGVSSGAVTTLALTTAGTYSSYPTNPVAQASTSGSGTGCTFDLDFEAINGSLVSPSGTALLPITLTPFSLVSVFRAPTVASAVTPAPGGIALGNALNHSATADMVNIRLTGLGVGYGTTSNAGKLIFRVRGDIYILYQSGAQDLRDGNWHVGMCDFVPATGATTLWLDGQEIATSTITGQATGVNTTTGGQQVRVGAAGLLGSLPVFGWGGDLGDQMIWPIALSGNATTRQLVQNYLLAKYGIGGSSA